MIFKDGEIAISPNIIYWIRMPDEITEKDRIELLKNDVLIIDCDYGIDEFEKLKIEDNFHTAYFFNLDALIRKEKDKNEQIHNCCSQTLKFISDYLPQRSVIHNEGDDKRISELFKSKGLIYLETSHFTNSNAPDNILNLIKHLFYEGNRRRRTLLRVALYPKIKFEIDILPIGKNKSIRGVIKDISLNGISVLIYDIKDVELFSLKENVNLDIHTESSVLKILSAKITRIDQTRNEMGLNFNILDTKIVHEETSHFLTKTIYNWISNIISEYGRKN
jgi:hypothetical protein